MQTKPLRAYGIDVTQMSMQPILDSLGITDRTIKEMSQAEKEILRYLATLQQARNAMGDLANTIESPSNQLKVFRQQLVEAKVAMSSLFIGGLANILPYANAFLMVVKEVSRAIADMFGIELKDYNSGIASSEDTFVDLGDSVDDATGKVKELKRQVLGFDQIHNINENKDNGSGSSISGGIDQRLLDAIHGYDNGMDKVRMKATEIRDRIMEWLGFTKEIDPLTGEVSFKYKGIGTTLKNIWNSFIGLNTQGKILVGLGLYSLAKNLFGSTKKLNTELGTGTGLLGTTKKLLSPMKSLYQSLDNVNYYNKSLTKGLSEGITNWSKSLTMADKFKVSLIGILGLSTSMNGMANAMKNVTTEGWNLGNSLQAVASGLGGIASGAYIGSIFGPWGTIIGGATGAILELTSALFGCNEGIKELAKEDLFGSINISTENWKEMLDNLNISIYDNTVKFEKLKTDLSALSATFDESASKLDFYGFKFGQLSQKITDEDSVNIKNAIKNMCDSTNSIIETSTTYNFELWSTTFKNMSVITEDEEKNILNSILNYGEQQKSELKIAQDNITKTYDNAIKTRGYLTDEEYNYIQQQLQKIRELTESEMSLSQTNIEYYKKMFASKNQSLDEESYRNYKEALDNYHKEKLKAIESTYNQELNSAKNLYDKGVISQQQYNDLLETAYKQRNDDVKKLDEEINKYTNEVIESLKVKYNQLLNDNSKFGQAQKKIIEGIFTNLNINYAEFKTAGKKAVSYFTDGWGNGGSFTLHTNLGGGGGGGRFNANGGIYSNGTWKNIPQYANGGMPSHGSMFIAGERGAEIVGHINGKTEVLNQSQIASAIYNAVVSAMSKFSGGGIAEINVHADEGIIVETAINGINQKTSQTGVCPVKIPTY